MRLNLFKSVLPLTWRSALRDIQAGITFASMDVPQVLGYTRIAGMPVVTGLYTVLLPLLGFALFGSSRHLVVAADSATATIFASALSVMAPAGSERYVALVGMVALLTAVFLLFARVFRLGFLADFLSRTVLVGFLAGVGIQVGVAMLGDMLGLNVQAPRTLEQINAIVHALPRLQPGTLTLSVLVALAVLLGKRYTPRVPVPMVAVVGGIAASYFYHFAEHGVAIIGPVAGGLPHLALPRVSWAEIRQLLPVAASCFVMIVAQSAAAARVFGERYHERVDENADILGLSAANMAAAFTGAFVVNGSPTQTAMADLAGARSQLAQLVFAAVVVVVLLCLTGPLQYLPHCILAAIVFTTAIGLIKVADLREIRRESPGEFTLAIVTAAAVVLVGVEQGILLAMALSLMRHVNHSYRPHTTVLTPDVDGRWRPVATRAGVETEPGLVVYRFGADLFFANANRFTDEVRALVGHAPTAVRCFVVDAGTITDLDFSAARVVRELCEELGTRGVKLVFGRVNMFLRSDMDRHGITAVIGAAHIFPTLHEALESVRGGPLPLKD
jgi:SulP family sulfate permease